MPERSRTVVNATSPSPPTWSRTFPATPRHVGQARMFLASILDGSPVSSDAVLCLSELAANAVLHSASAHPGGTFTVCASLHPSRLRVEVHDQGGPWQPPATSDGQDGRGLHIVSQTASQWGTNGDSTSARVVWFEIVCPRRAQGAGQDAAVRRAGVT